MNFQEAYRKAKAQARGQKVSAPAKPKAKSTPKENTKQRVKEIAAARAVKQQRQELGRQRETVFATVPLNLHEKIPVQVDSRTIVYMNPGDDPDRIIAKYKRKPLADKIDL